MKLSEMQSHNVAHSISIPYPITWSDDDIIATITDKGLQIMDRRPCNRRTNKRCVDPSANILNGLRVSLLYVLVLMLALDLNAVSCIDMTYNVFGTSTDGMPAAFGDFNSDKFTDMFVLRDGGRTVEILLGSDTEPLLRHSGTNLTCTFHSDQKITSVVPGDFDGDAFMDVLVTIRPEQRSEDHPYLNYGYILWGNGVKLNCTDDRIKLTMDGQPLAMDWDQDMVTDLFGVNIPDVKSVRDEHRKERRGFWVFNHNRTQPTFKDMDTKGLSLEELRVPHSHAFLDLNSDSYGDLYLTTKSGSAEVWLYDAQEKDFRHSYTMEPPPGVNVSKGHYIGQTIFQDMALEGKIDILVPVCFDVKCSNSTLFLQSNGHWHNIKIQFNEWHMIHPLNPEADPGIYRDTLTLRPGDYNMDGFPDLLATLTYEKHYRTFLVENVECDQINNCNGFPRTFKVRNDAIPLTANNNTVLGVFYDFLQDGILDIIFVHEVDRKRSVSAFRNSLDYDANFVKVMVLTGVMNDKAKPVVFHTALMKKQRIYGTNLPGPTILYHTTTQEGNPRSAISTQLPQSAHFSLNLPYTIFGLGRTPNFVDELKVGVYGHERVWTQLIPNSQMVVIPRPPDGPTKWKVQLFVTPSKLILQSVFALLGTCVLISLIIGGLYWKERKEDHRERLQEAQKFHFDAM